MTTPRILAFVPARAGSKRVPDKNIRPLGGHPLLAWSIRAARESGVFASVICATDSPDYARIAEAYGAEVPFLRDPAISGDRSPDIEWVLAMIERLEAEGRSFDAYSILRPTSPFRRADTIVRAWEAFIADRAADSLRAVEKCGQHPGKMWVIRGRRMQPLMPFEEAGTPWHSSQYAALPEIWVQNASLEMAWTAMTLATRSIAGQAVIPFVTEGLEGFDINHPEDWMLAEHYVSEGLASFPGSGAPRAQQQD